MKYFLLSFLLVVHHFSYAQINLVPNPSFEDTVYCPTGIRQVDACQHWLNFGNSPDYFNACSNPAFGVPNATFGFQYAHTGNAYAGAVFYARPNLPSGPNIREFIGIEMLSNLIVGQKYFVSFFVVNAGVNNGSIACNKQGINFYTVPFDSCCPPPLLNTANLYNDSILTDTLNWTKISGSFIADSAYRYLCISNFFNDTNTDTIITSPFSIPYHAYYYIDDVCVSADSNYNQTWTGINQTGNIQNSINIYPNPTQGFLRLESPIPIQAYSLYNIHGQVISNVETKNAYSTLIDLSSLSKGIYIIRIYTQSFISTHKIILTH